MKHFSKYLVLLLALMMASCKKYDIAGIFYETSPEVNERFASSMEWNSAHGYAVIQVPSNNYKVYVCADSHITPDNDANFKRFVLDYKSDKNCPFAIHLGDLINDKGYQPLFEQDLKLKPEGYTDGKDTVFTVVGNHDLYFNQWSEFLKYRHTSTYYVETVQGGQKLDLFIFLDSGSGTMGTKQTAWLKNLLENCSGYRNIIICTHTHFFERDLSQKLTSNYTMEETTSLTSMFTKYGVDLVLTGHDHHAEDTTYGYVRYLVLDGVNDAQKNAAYTVLSVGNEITYETVKLLK